MLDILILAAALAGTADDAAARCAGITEDTKRLACYDTAYRKPVAPQPAARPASHSSSPAEVSTASSIATNSEAEFGLSGQEKDKRRGAVSETDRIRSMVTAVEPDRSGKPSFRLENGQRWIQTEATDRPAIETGDTLEIRRASLGSFLASVPDSGRPAVRVRRLE